jgi:hypothetical protein
MLYAGAWDTVTSAPDGDVFVGYGHHLGGGGEKGIISRFAADGTSLGNSGLWSNGSNVSGPSFLGSDPLGRLLYIYGIGGSGNQYVAAVVATPEGAVLKRVEQFRSLDGFPRLGLGRVEGDAAGRVLMAAQVLVDPGWPDPGIDFGAGLEAGDLLLRYDAAGAYLGSVPSPGEWRGDGTGSVYALQRLQGTLDVGCGPLTSAAPGTVLAKRSFDGACLWSKAIPAPQPVYHRGFSVGADQRPLLALVTTGPLDLGSGPLPDGGAQNLTLARWDAQGNLLLARSFGGPGASFSEVYVDATAGGQILLVARFSGTVDLGAGPLTGGNGFAAAFEPDGTLRWSRVYQVTTGGFLNYGSAIDMARHPCGMLFYTNRPSVDLGSGPLVPAAAWGEAPGIAVALLAL